MHALSVAELSVALRERRVSSEELTRLFLSRIARLNGRLNALVTVDEERALASARAADRRLARREAGPLTGIPIAHKDLFCARGWRTTCGSRMLADFVAPYDAHIVERLEAAGTVHVGKANMDEFAMGSSNENSHFGPVRNPWDAARVPGGSSGGSAAAVAARLVPAATGSDTGGSIRQPAALTGICGIKPTYGAVSRYGMVAYASSLDQAGVFAHSAEDLALLLTAMAGFDPRDATSVERAPEDYGRALNAPIAGLRIGVPRQYLGDGVSPDVARAVRGALDTLNGLGARVVEVSLPNQRLAVPAYYVIAPAEASSNLSRFDGVRYGHRAEGAADLASLYRRSRSEGLGPEVQRRVLIGTYVLSHGYYDAYYRQAQKVRRLVADDFARAFEQCDVIAGPTTPTVAFPIGRPGTDPVQMYLEDLFTIPVNLAGLPGVSIPCGAGESGLPVGLQLIGRAWDEAKLLGVAHAYQQSTDWHRRAPPEEP